MNELDRQRHCRLAVEHFLEAAAAFESVDPGVNSRWELRSKVLRGTNSPQTDIPNLHSMLGACLVRLTIAGWSIALVEPKP